MQPESRRRGETHHRAKYPDAVVVLVRALQAQDGLGYVRIAKQLALNVHWVRAVCDGTIRQQRVQAATA